MTELVRTLGFQLILQIITGLQLACVVELMLERKYIPVRRAVGCFLGLLLGDILITIFKGGVDSYTGIIIFIIFIIYDGKIFHKVLAIFVSMGISAISEILNWMIIDYILNDALELGIWDKVFLQLGSMILIIVGIVIFKSAGIMMDNKRGFKYLLKRDIISLTGLSIFTIFIWSIGLMVYNGSITAVNNPRFLCAVIVGVLLLDLSVLIIINKNTNTNYYKQINAVMEAQLIKQLDYYERLEEISKETRGMKHDMINHIVCMKGLLESGEIDQLRSYVDSIINSIKTNTKVIKTGNVIVDAILNEKYSIAIGRKINIDIDVILPKDIKIHMVDLCSIISNAIDNAIEASEKIPEIEKRWIEIIGTYNKGYFVFYVINGTLEYINIKNNTIVTTKRDKEKHGYGLWNIKNSVNKYNGDLNLEYKENKFKLEVIINTSYA